MKNQLNVRVEKKLINRLYRVATAVGLEISEVIEKVMYFHDEQELIDNLKEVQNADNNS